MKKFYDIFNGDADGICALHQLRLAEPRPEAELVTGVKRDVRLLDRITGAREADCTVLDISLDSNRAALERLLAAGCRVFYVDHHYAGDLPASPLLTAHIDPAADICTSLIIDRLLGGRFRGWAVAAAFGDNLHDAARQAAAAMGLDESDTLRLRELGELLNYNGYGATEADLHFHPRELYLSVRPHRDPFDFLAESEAIGQLRSGFRDDMARAEAVLPLLENEAGRVYHLPGEPWARRVAGVFSNQKARQQPALAHALMTANDDGSLRISVRAPLADRRRADELCLAFPTGGGRAAAAGINALPAPMLDAFLEAFRTTFGNR